MTVSASIERAIARVGNPIPTGVFVAVTGPSGSGKDTLIAYARGRLAPGDDVLFVRRLITRKPDPAAEDHDGVDEIAFENAKSQGLLALSWQANGLSYGLSADIDDAMRDGRVVVANISRAAIAPLRLRYANAVVVAVTAPPAVLASRLAARGREGETEIRARLERGARPIAHDGDQVTISNATTVEEAGERFLGVIRKALAWSAVSQTI